jgi:putative Mg2+ transporter-C (MgtC) family protein
MRWPVQETFLGIWHGHPRFFDQRSNQMLIGSDWLADLLRLGAATLAGLAIGAEREWHHHDAGLRTNALVALSAAIITISALSMSADASIHGRNSDPVRVVQGLAQAIGFIAGGLIFIRGGDVRNMTTATSLWLSAAAGIAAGAGQFALLTTGVVLALAVIILLRFLEHRMSPRDVVNSGEVGPIGMPNRRGQAPAEDD